MKRVTISRLREVLEYNPSDGVFRWRVSNGRRAVAGEVAGSLQPKGQIHIGIDRRVYQAHRLAWLYMTGEWPETQIDHKDCDRANNAFNNLRLATNQQNSANRRGWRRSPKGVIARPCGTKWRARIRVNNKLISLGDFVTEAEAAAAYRAAAERHFGEFARV